MHGKRFLIQDLSYGSDGQNLYTRVDFDAASSLGNVDAHLTIRPASELSRESYLALALGDTGVQAREVRLAEADCGPAAIEAAFRKVLEIRLSLRALAVPRGQSLQLQVSLWKDGLPVDAVPSEGWLELSTAEPTDWPL
jgi:hypothetical protein